METQEKTPMLVTKKKAHTDAILSIDVLETNNDILVTCSEDKTIRLWDLRMNSSIKQYKDPIFKDNSLSNAKINPDGSKLHVGAGRNILEFDLKTEKILIDKSILSHEKARDEINFVAVSPDGKYIASCDDSHDIQVYDSQTLDTIGCFRDNHTNIPFTLDFMNPSDKPVPYCISSGFDTVVIFWDIEKKAPIKNVNITELCAKYIKGQLISPPLVYNICVRQSTVLVSVETGHIIALTFKEHKKPKYIIDAHLGKVMRSTFCRFNDNIIASVSNDKTFALWDINNRDIHGVPSFLRKVGIPEKPNWIETTRDKKILVADTSEYLSIYTIKE